MTEFLDQDTNRIIKRPDGLTFLCVLSFMGSGLALISNLYIFLLYQSIPDLLESEDLMEIANVDTEMMLSFIQATGRIFFLISSVLYATSLSGVYLMWHLRKKGIHFYAIAQILLLIISLLFMNSQYSVLPGLLMTVLFILLYAKYYKIMN